MQYGRHCPDDIFKCIFVNENVLIWIQILLKFVHKGSINNIPSLIQIMACRRPGDKSLSESMMVSLLTHICIARPQWVDEWVIKFNDISWIADSKVHVIHIGRVIITYTLESLSSLTYNMQSTGYD